MKTRIARTIVYILHVRCLLLPSLAFGFQWCLQTGSRCRQQRTGAPAPLFLSTSSTFPSEVLSILAKSKVLGDLYRIGLQGEDDSFVSAMGVPTFACKTSSPDPTTDEPAVVAPSLTSRRLEGVLNQGPAFVLDNIFSKEQCDDIINTCETLGFGNYNSGKNNHGAMQLLVTSQLADTVAQALSRHVDIHEVEIRRMESEKASLLSPSSQRVELVLAGLNRRWRVYKYQSNSEETFAPHIDAGFPPSGLREDGMKMVWDTNDDVSSSIVSRLTVLLYLSDNFEGGHTAFYQPQVETNGADPKLIASVKPQTGSCLIFPQAVGETAVEYARQHWPLHEGAPVLAGNSKYVIRSDILFATVQRESLMENPTVVS